MVVILVIVSNTYCVVETIFTRCTLIIKWKNYYLKIYVGTFLFLTLIEDLTEESLLCEEIYRPLQ